MWRSVGEHHEEIQKNSPSGDQRKLQQEEGTSSPLIVVNGISSSDSNIQKKVVQSKEQNKVRDFRTNDKSVNIKVGVSQMKKEEFSSHYKSTKNGMTNGTASTSRNLNHVVSNISSPNNNNAHMNKSTKKIQGIVGDNQYRKALTQAGRVFSHGKMSQTELIYRSMYISYSEHDFNNQDTSLSLLVSFLESASKQIQTSDDEHHNVYQQKISQPPPPPPQDVPPHSSSVLSPTNPMRKLNFPSPELSFKQASLNGHVSKENKSHLNQPTEDEFIDLVSSGPSATLSILLDNILWSFFRYLQIISSRSTTTTTTISTTNILDIQKNNETSGECYIFHSLFLKLCRPIMSELEKEERCCLFQKKDNDSISNIALSCWRILSLYFGRYAALVGNVVIMSNLMINSHGLTNKENNIIVRLCGLEGMDYQSTSSPSSDLTVENGSTRNNLSEGSTTHDGIATMNSNGSHHHHSVRELPTTPAAQSQSQNQSQELIRELEKERTNSAKLKRRVEDLTETCHALEEEACSVHEQVHRLSAEKKNNDSDYSSAAAAILSPLAKSPANSSVSSPQNGMNPSRIPYYQTIEALEHALKIQVVKRIEVQVEIAQLRKDSPTRQTVDTSSNTAQSDITKFFQEVRSLISLLKENNDQSNNNLGSVQSQLLDFDELLTGFLFETDGLDGDEDEATMDRKDVIWFLNELKLRLGPIQKSCDKDSQMMTDFTQQLALLVEKNITNKSNESGENSALIYKNQLMAKEILMSKLLGKIADLEEFKEKYEKSENNGSSNRKSPTSKSKRDYDSLLKKHKHLETRHRSIVSEMQGSINAKDQVIAELKENTPQEDDAKILETETQAYQNEIKSLEIGIEERNALIEEMRIELENSSSRKEPSVAGEVDKIRLRYLEGIVHDLERKLAVATRSPSCPKYGSISLFDVETDENISHLDNV